VLNSPFLSGNGNAVTYSCARNRFVAVGQNAANTIAFSLDGKIWTGLGKTVAKLCGFY
jgi:hypothetical protein